MPPSVELRIVDPAGPEARWAMGQYFDELARRLPAGFDPGDAASVGAQRYRPPTGRFVLVAVDGEAAGCGALDLLDEHTAEVKRMWISPAHRGRGLARRLLARLEQEAVGAGRRRIVLDTSSVLTEAIALYEQAGYAAVERYNDNPYAERWFAKDLA